jgi:hypothetical protein
MTLLTWQRLGDHRSVELEISDDGRAVRHSEVARAVMLMQAVSRTEKDIADTLRAIAETGGTEAAARRLKLAEAAIIGAREAAERGEELRRLAEWWARHADMAALRRSVDHAHRALTPRRGRSPTMTARRAWRQGPEDRDQAADDRDEAARARDLAAETRNHDSTIRDTVALERDDAAVIRDRRMQERLRTASQRNHATLAREAAARAREAAAREREAAAADRQQAAIERAQEHIPLRA